MSVRVAVKDLEPALRVDHEQKYAAVLKELQCRSMNTPRQGVMHLEKAQANGITVRAYKWQLGSPMVFRFSLHQTRIARVTQNGQTQLHHTPEHPLYVHYAVRPNTVTYFDAEHRFKLVLTDDEIWAEGVDCDGNPLTADTVDYAVDSLYYNLLPLGEPYYVALGHNVKGLIAATWEAIQSETPTVAKQ